jgi:hypothetical protein
MAQEGRSTGSSSTSAGSSSGSSSSGSRSTANGGTNGGTSSMRVSTEDVRGAIEGVSRQVPEVAGTSMRLFDEAMRGIERSSDERVAAGVTLSLGLAVGMLIGGAPRLLIAIALIPVAAIGMVMMDRRTRGTASTRSARAAE